MERFLDVAIAGLLLGGLYALIAMGMSLQYGVARVFNIAHGEFIMLGAMTTWTLYTVFNISPLVAVVICGPPSSLVLLSAGRCSESSKVYRPIRVFLKATRCWRPSG